MAPTPDRAAATIPSAGSLSVPTTEEVPGPPDGLTLDQAIDRLIHENLDLRAKAFEIPQARADVLTASLRANPIFYADTQLVPYGQYTRDRPGGQTQYDVNINLSAGSFAEADLSDRLGRTGDPGDRSPVSGCRAPDGR